MKNHSKHHTFAGHAIVAQQEFPKLEVSAAADGQEFGESLNDPEYQRF